MKTFDDIYDESSNLEDYSGEYKRCFYCGEEIPSNLIYEDDNGNLICGICFADLDSE